MERPPSNQNPGRENDRKQPDNVIALSRYRAELDRGRRLRRADALLSGPDPERAIRALPGDEFYYVIHELGLRDAGDILLYARPEQVQAALDFALWDRDQIVPERMTEWLEALADAPYERIGDWLAGMDVELLALVIRKVSRIYDLTQEEPPEEPAGTTYATPDGFFLLDVGGGDGEGHDGGEATGSEAHAGSANAVIRLLDSLYRADLALARRILVGARAELDSELEEMAYRWRQGRMADLGFSDYYEALEVYRELDPASVKPGEAELGSARVRPSDAAATGAPPSSSDTAARLPAALIDRVGSGATPFARAARALTRPEETAELHFAMIALTNRVLAADRVSPGEDAAVGEVLERMAATLDVAVEFMARGDEAVAREAVRTIPLVRLFRLGVSLTGKLRRLALALRKKGPFAMAGRDLFEPADALVLQAVSRARPLYPSILDDPPGMGERPFRALADLARVTAAVERAAAAQAMLIGLGVTPRDVAPGADALRDVSVDQEALEAGILARTALVRRLLASGPGAPVAFGPLEARDVRAFQALLEDARGGPPRLPDTLRKRARALLDAAAPARLAGAAAEVAERWVASLAPLETVLVRKAPRRPRKR